MSVTTTSETQPRESAAFRLRQAVRDAVFAVVQLAPKAKQLQQNPSTWFAIRLALGTLGAALVVLPLSLGNFLVLPILGLALFLAATLLPPSPHDVSDDEIARELGAQIVLNGGDYQAGSVLGFPAKLFVGEEEVCVLDPLHRTLVVIPLAKIASADAEETDGKWAFRVRWSGEEALFRYDGMFAEQFAKTAQDTVRGRMRRAEPPVKAMSRAAGA
jgi:hypothetical protein